MVVLYILLFIVFLSVLIMIHELGHLIAAKAFKVYCFEYAIGFGPKLFSIKKENWETAFSLRAIPLGGFVSMYGEAESVPEGVTVDPSRSLYAISHWKRAIIMVAGVTMNFVLAILIFFVYELAFPTYTPRYAHVTISNNSIASSLGLKSGDTVYSMVASTSDNSYILYDQAALLTYEDNSTQDVFFGFSYSDLTLKDTAIYSKAVAYKSLTYGELNIYDYTDISVQEIYNSTSMSETDNFKVSGFVSSIVVDKGNNKVYYLVDNDFASKANEQIIFAFDYENETELNNLIKVPMNYEATVIGKYGVLKEVGSDKEYKAIKCVDKNILFNYPDTDSGSLLAKTATSKALKSISFDFYKVNDASHSGKGDKISVNNVALTLSGDKYILDSKLGVNMQIDTYYSNFGEALGKTFVDFGETGSVIYRSLWSLLTSSESWKDVGGIIAIGVVSTRTLQNNGFGPFLYMWGMISVNLGIVNLLPFPGLDGWQLLVTAVEGIFKKEIPQKVKTWVSFVGIAILFAFMILIIIKDLITFI